MESKRSDPSRRAVPKVRDRAATEAGAGARPRKGGQAHVPSTSSSSARGRDGARGGSAGAKGPDKRSGAGAKDAPAGRGGAGAKDAPAGKGARASGPEPRRGEAKRKDAKRTAERPRATENARGGKRPQQPPKKVRPPLPVPEGPPRSGRVALIGRPNVGKSTILNAALEQPLAIVSPVPQTTREALLGVVHHGSAELLLLDTPGLHRPRTELGRVMNVTAREAARSADVVVFVTDVPQVDKGQERDLRPHPGDLTLLADIGAELPTILVVNKVDRVKEKGRLLPLLDALMKIRPFAAIVPISALRRDGIAKVLDEVAQHLPEAPWTHEADDVTDRPTRFFAAEYVREQILRATQAEVPHAAAVVIDRYVEPPGEGTIHIDASIYVERPGQKRILIGRAGEMLKHIGTRARLRIEELVERKVNLKLWVRVTPAWRESRAQLEELGYTTTRTQEGGTLIIAESLPPEIAAALATLDAEGDDDAGVDDEDEGDDADGVEADDDDEEDDAGDDDASDEEDEQ